MDLSPIHSDYTHGPISTMIERGYQSGDEGGNWGHVRRSNYLFTNGEYRQLSDRLFVKQAPGDSFHRWSRVLYQDIKTNEWHGCTAQFGVPDPFCLTDDVRYFTSHWAHQTNEEFQTGGVMNKPQNMGSSSGVVDCKTEPG